jgi:hypothetical protein
MRRELDVIEIYADPEAICSKVGYTTPERAVQKFLDRTNHNPDQACQLAQRYIVGKKDQQRIMRMIWQAARG